MDLADLELGNGYLEFHREGEGRIGAAAEGGWVGEERFFFIFPFFNCFNWDLFRFLKILGLGCNYLFIFSSFLFFFFI